MNVDTILHTFFNNFGFIMMLVGIVIALVRTAAGKPFFVELLRWSLVFGVGVNALYSGLGHVFMPDYSAKMIGWEDSPFQLEVGMADIAFGVAGLMCIKGNYGFQLATAIMAMIFFGGDAIGHIHQMQVAGNFANGNAGSWFWIDCSLPFILLISAIVVGMKGSKPIPSSSV
jgi:hypothetical protein